MTHSERRIVEHLMTTDATGMEDLPDWFLASVESGDGDGPSPELITAASLLLVRRERPGIGFGAARRVLAAYAGDPARHKELAAKIQAFRLSCHKWRWSSREETTITDTTERGGLLRGRRGSPREFPFVVSVMKRD